MAFSGCARWISLPSTCGSERPQFWRSDVDWVLPGSLQVNLVLPVVITDYMQEPLIFAEHNWYLNNKFSAEFKLLDWRSPDPNLFADVILAADVAYESKAFADLILSFKTLIKAGGVLILAEPNRAFAKTFFDKLRTDGFLLYTDQTFVERHGQKTLVNIPKIYFSHWNR